MKFLLNTKVHNIHTRYLNNLLSLVEGEGAAAATSCERRTCRPWRCLPARSYLSDRPGSKQLDCRVRRHAVATGCGDTKRRPPAGSGGRSPRRRQGRLVMAIGGTMVAPDSGS